MTTVNLTKRNLLYMPLPAVIELIRSQINATATGLNLGNNSLGSENLFKLVEILSALQQTSLTYLSLEDNLLERKKEPSEYFTKLFSPLAESAITSLSLAGNDFISGELVAILSALPAKIDTLDLTSCFDRRVKNTKGKVKQIGDLLFNSGRNIVLNGNSRFEQNLKVYLKLRRDHQAALATVETAFTAGARMVSQNHNGLFSESALAKLVTSYVAPPKLVNAKTSTWSA